MYTSVCFLFFFADKTRVHVPCSGPLQGVTDSCIGASRRSSNPPPRATIGTIGTLSRLICCEKSSTEDCDVDSALASAQTKNDGHPPIDRSTDTSIACVIPPEKIKQEVVEEEEEEDREWEEYVYEEKEHDMNCDTSDIPENSASRDMQEKFPSPQPTVSDDSEQQDIYNAANGSHGLSENIPVFTEENNCGLGSFSIGRLAEEVSRKVKSSPLADLAVNHAEAHAPILLSMLKESLNKSDTSAPSQKNSPVPEPGTDSSSKVQPRPNDESDTSASCTANKTQPQLKPSAGITKRAPKPLVEEITRKTLPPRKRRGNNLSKLLAREKGLVGDDDDSNHSRSQADKADVDYSDSEDLISEEMDLADESGSSVSRIKRKRSNTVTSPRDPDMPALTPFLKKQATFINSLVGSAAGPRDHPSTEACGSENKNVDSVRRPKSQSGNFMATTENKLPVPCPVCQTGVQPLQLFMHIQTKHPFFQLGMNPKLDIKTEPMSD